MARDERKEAMIADCGRQKKEAMDAAAKEGCSSKLAD